MTEFPDVPDYRNELASVYWWLAGPSLHPETEQWARKALILQEKLAADFPAVADYRYDLLKSLVSLGTVSLNSHRSGDAEQFMRRAVQIGEQLVAESPMTHYYRSQLANVYRNLADALQTTDQLSQAESAYGRSIGLYEEVGSQFPQIKSGKSEVPLSYLRLAQLLTTAGRNQEAAEVYRRVVASSLEHPGALNTIAWTLATSPSEQHRDVERAVELAQKAIELDPQAGGIWNTLGVAQYRAGNWTAAISALEKSMELRNGGDSNDWFFLAMVHWQLGQKEEAHKWYLQGVAWMDANLPESEELRRFRVEAEELVNAPSAEPEHHEELEKAETAQ